MRTEYKGLRAMPTTGVCFKCRKSYSQIFAYNESDRQSVSICPECGSTLDYISSSVQIPKKSKVKAWDDIEKGQKVVDNSMSI
ncbi:MAG: hypothetical protein KAS32_28680 [Candidatus Peribacteraceae bacterium]|nr:hypothetical protein [Candidatus Peribacteraceae bacterium]